MQQSKCVQAHCGRWFGRFPSLLVRHLQGCSDATEEAKMTQAASSSQAAQIRQQALRFYEHYCKEYRDIAPSCIFRPYAIGQHLINVQDLLQILFWLRGQRWTELYRTPTSPQPQGASSSTGARTASVSAAVHDRVMAFLQFADCIAPPLVSVLLSGPLHVIKGFILRQGSFAFLARLLLVSLLAFPRTIMHMVLPLLEETVQSSISGFLQDWVKSSAWTSNPVVRNAGFFGFKVFSKVQQWVEAGADSLDERLMRSRSMVFIREDILKKYFQIDISRFRLLRNLELFCASTSVVLLLWTDVVYNVLGYYLARFGGGSAYRDLPGPLSFAHLIGLVHGGTNLRGTRSAAVSSKIEVLRNLVLSFALLFGGGGTWFVQHMVGRSYNQERASRSRSASKISKATAAPRRDGETDIGGEGHTRDARDYAEPSSSSGSRARKQTVDASPPPGVAVGDAWSSNDILTEAFATPEGSFSAAGYENIAGNIQKTRASPRDVLQRALDEGRENRPRRETAEARSGSASKDKSPLLKSDEATSPASASSGGSSFVDVMEPIDVFQLTLTTVSTLVGAVIGLEAGRHAFDGIFGDDGERQRRRDYATLSLLPDEWSATNGDVLHHYVDKSRQALGKSSSAAIVTNGAEALEATGAEREEPEHETVRDKMMIEKRTFNNLAGIRNVKAFIDANQALERIDRDRDIFANRIRFRARL
ncbi:unnamed protein product [Amoebophrya sp. A25]|nr:unnamed protein product [Amoebophrya sp. A25]|eukprot:GSA25T00023592001.1